MWTPATLADIDVEMTWDTPCLRYVYDRAIEQYPSGTFLEVGSLCGGSAIYLALHAMQHSSYPRIYCVDLWAESPDIDWGWMYTEILERNKGDLLPLFMKNIEKYSVDHLITPIRGCSWEVATGFPDDYFDMVYIDGGHGFETCLNDLVAYWPKIKPGGILAGHDYWSDKKMEERPNWSHFPGVRKAVDTFSDAMKIPFELYDYSYIFNSRSSHPLI
jgi:MMP 1-O-methyltransferase